MRIMICEEKEYGRRLTEYLTRHLSGHVRVQSFTTCESFMEEKESADIYLLAEPFADELKVLDLAPPCEKTILLTDYPTEDGYCRWDSPKQLIHIIQKRISESKVEQNLSAKGPRLIAVYSPSAEVGILDWIWPHMEEGSLYIGFEDIGDPYQSSRLNELCYFIHLHEPEILSVLQGIARMREGRFCIDSPVWYFDFLGLKEEDYAWFYKILKEESAYQNIYIGLGHAAIPSLEYFKCFDGVIFVDQPKNSKIHSFCERMATAIVTEGYLTSDHVICRSHPKKGEAFFA